MLMEIFMTLFILIYVLSIFFYSLQISNNGNNSHTYICLSHTAIQLIKIML